MANESNITDELPSKERHCAAHTGSSQFGLGMNDFGDHERISPSASPAAIKLQNVVVGTTSVCNASCVHCPTNKAETRHLKRGTMSMTMFKRIIDQLASSTVSVAGPISFGLFGDGLVDPFVAARAAYLREQMPTAFVNINTNGAAYLRQEHIQLRDTVSAISLHIESLDSITYNRLMAPLRLDRVLPNCLALAKDFGRKLFVSIPLSRANWNEKDKLESFFLERGAGCVTFLPMMNRCSDNPIFAELAFKPHPMTCRGNLLADVIVDWEGDVLACCQDFAKRLQIGDLSSQTLLETLNSAERHKLGSMLDAGRWKDLPTCSTCLYDCGNGDTTIASNAEVRHDIFFQ